MSPSHAANSRPDRIYDASATVEMIAVAVIGPIPGMVASRAIRATGAKILFLPPYSPDLNPVEMAFAKLKSLLRKAGERSRDAFWQRIGILIDLFTPQECAVFLRHAG